MESNRFALVDSTWTRVDQFNDSSPSPQVQRRGSNPTDADANDDEWEYEEEEEYVTLDLGPDLKQMVQISNEISLTGLDSSHPFLQLGSLIFKGKWDQLIGTEILLKEESDDVSRHMVRPLPPSQGHLRYGRPPSTTRRRIQFFQVTDMASKEHALLDRAQDNQKARQGTGLISHKGFIWVRGHGWVQKEQSPWLEDVIAGRTAAAESEQGQQQHEPTHVEGHAPLHRDDPVQENGGQESSTYENRNTLPPAQNPNQRRGRHTMTDDEKMRGALHRGLLKLQAKRLEEGRPSNDDQPDADEG